MKSFVTFAAGWPVILAGVALWAGLGLLGWQNWRRNRNRRGLAALELLRFVAVGLVVVTLWRPEMRRLLGAAHEPVVAVLADASRSMTTRDVTLSTTNVVSRREWLAQLGGAPIWGELSNRFRVVREDFSPEPAAAGGPAATNTAATVPEREEGTDINGALERVAASGINLRAVLLLSDGDWNAGSSPVAAATRLRAMGVPVFTVGVGAADYLPDLVLERVAAPAYGLLGEQVFIGFTVRSHLDREVKTVIRLTDPQGAESAKPLVIPAHGTVQDAVFWTPLQEGQVRLALALPVEKEELQAGNNAQTFDLTVRKEMLKVLVIESLPRWEYRYLRNALERDPGVDVRCVLFHPGLKLGAGRDYLPGVPRTREELADFDVVFLGDVGLGDGELTATDAANLRGLVEQQGSGLVFLPGRRGRVLTLRGTPLGEMLPVELDDQQPQGFAASDPARLVLTQRGRGHLLTMLATTEEANAELWRGLPGFTWSAPVRKSKGGADVLAVHELARNEWGRLPLLVTRLQGNGKVLFMGTDGAWRWRRGVEDTYHYRFWGQVVRWMAYQRHLAQERGIRIFFSPESPRRGGTVSVHATALDPSGLPLKGGRVTLEVTSPRGRVDRQELRAIAGEWGVFEGEVATLEKGDYQLKARVESTNREVATVMSVRGDEREVVGRPAQMEVLREVARVSQGAFGTLADVEPFIRRIEALPEQETVEQRIRLWCHPLWGGALLLLLTLYWAGRKLVGLV